jgi:hypothetical protein
MAENQRAWLRNEGSFPMVDPETNTRFEPGETKKAEVTAWVKNQPAIKRVTDPNDDSPTDREVQKIEDLNAADEAARIEREHIAERAQRLANGQVPVEEAISQANAEAAGATPATPAT